MSVRETVAPLVGAAYAPASEGPSHGCWAVVRDAYRLLGVPMPDSHTEAVGRFRVAGTAAPGRIVVFDRAGEQHVVLVVDRTYALHLGTDRRACLSPLAPLLAGGRRARFAEPMEGLTWD